MRTEISCGPNSSHRRKFQGNPMQCNRPNLIVGPKPQKELKSPDATPMGAGWAQSADSVTGHYLSGRQYIPMPDKMRTGHEGKQIGLIEAQVHTLQNMPVGVAACSARYKVHGGAGPSLPSMAFSAGWCGSCDVAKNT